MFKRPIAFVLLLALAAGAVFGQTPQEKDKASDAVFNKIRKIDLLFNISPLVLTKAQINALLPVLEKCRQRIRETRDLEYDQYRAVELRIDKSIEIALTKGDTPSRQLRSELTLLLSKLDTTRAIIVQLNIGEILPVFDKVLNAGQRKAAANSLRPETFGLDVKLDKMTQEEKEKLFIREIILDPLTYDMLVEMAKHLP
ncbi:MAG: hypothetical protein HYR64_00480 [Fimbriimonas ginsengisoli]|uniref:Uncharacterized protein n=1 Tax=Fimbriimonas ginsengisoli TaxID=1005039 RepID=A0A931LQL6_FIMGI|nr:hypothetical protein [Fimbriimonas ginsengisoli]